MLKYISAVALLATSATAHEMTPTYFELNISPVNGVYTTTMSVFNRRKDANLYNMEAYTKDWDPIPYASFDREFTIEYGEGIDVDLYFRPRDLNRLVYICSRSIIESEQSSGVSSLICSKILR